MTHPNMSWATVRRLRCGHRCGGRFSYGRGGTGGCGGHDPRRRASQCDQDSYLVELAGGVPGSVDVRSVATTLGDRYGALRELDVPDQRTRAEVSALLNARLAGEATALGVPVVAARPWSTALDRTAAALGLSRQPRRFHLIGIGSALSRHLGGGEGATGHLWLRGWWRGRGPTATARRRRCHRAVQLGRTRCGRRRVGAGRPHR